MFVFIFILSVFLLGELSFLNEPRRREGHEGREEKRGVHTASLGCVDLLNFSDKF